MKRISLCLNCLARNTDDSEWELQPKQQARRVIDANFAASGWVVQYREEMNLAANRGVAVRESPLVRDHGFADYLLFVDGKAVGVLEAKPAGNTLSVPPGSQLTVARTCHYFRPARWGAVVVLDRWF